MNFIPPLFTRSFQHCWNHEVHPAGISPAPKTFTPMGVIVAGGHRAVAVVWQMSLTALEFAPQTAVTFTEARVAPLPVRATAVVPSGMENVAEPDASVETVAPPEVRRGDVAFWVLHDADALQADAPSETVQPFALSVPVAGVGVVQTPLTFTCGAVQVTGGLVGVVPPSPPPPQATSAPARRKNTNGEPNRLSARSNRCGLWAVGCGLWAVGCGLWAVGCCWHGHGAPSRV